jgi:hypothetical protein
MGHDQDWIERLRLWLIPKLGRAVQYLNHRDDSSLYVAYELHNKEFVGRVDMPEEEFEERLVDMGFERNPIAALKTNSAGETEEGSWRKVGFENHPNRQLHVILFDGDAMNDAPTGSVYIYAHWELRWDTDPVDHYKGVGYSGPEGVRRMKKMLNVESIVYELERPPAQN